MSVNLLMALILKTKFYPQNLNFFQTYQSNKAKDFSFLLPPPPNTVTILNHNFLFLCFFRV